MARRPCLPGRHRQLRHTAIPRGSGSRGPVAACSRYTRAAVKTDRRTSLLLLSPLPPPQGGIAAWTSQILDSTLPEHFELRVLDTAVADKETVSQHSRFRFDRAFHALRILFLLLRDLVVFRPDLVHVTTPLRWAMARDATAVWLAHVAGARTLFHFRGGVLRESVETLPWPLRALVRATLRRTDRLIALTQPTRSYLETVAAPERVRYLPNFISLETVGEPPDRRARPEGAVRVLFVGWIVEAKGVRELLAAAREVKGARFALVGHQEPGFVASIRDELAELAARVELLPARPRQEVMALYREADLFVLPSWTEGFPNVVLEAMACGLPVVATTVGAIPDAVRDGEEGLLVAPRDPAALAAAIARLVSDRELRLAMGEAARRRAVRVFSREVVLEQLEAIYRELEPAARD